MRNLGNTCFAAAAVRALAACPRAVDAVSLDRTALGVHLASVMRDPASAAWPALVRELDGLLGRRRHEQHDSHELICAVVDRLGLDPRFTVRTVTGLKCGACGKVTAREETNIHVTAEPSASIASGLAAAHAPRWVEGILCDEGCGRRHRAAMRTVPKGPAPDVLVVRTTQGRLTWVEHGFAYCGDRFRLRAVVVYRGSGQGGHYTCCVLQDGGRWVSYDDDSAGDAAVTTVSGASALPDVHTVLYEKA